MIEPENAYDKGYLDALKAYAWWSDGIELVGNCGTPLKRAIKQRKDDYYYNPPEEED